MGVAEPSTRWYTVIGRLPVKEGVAEIGRHNQVPDACQLWKRLQKLDDTIKYLTCRTNEGNRTVTHATNICIRNLSVLILHPKVSEIFDESCLFVRLKINSIIALPAQPRTQKIYTLYV
jgi:hypothetical protein